MVRHADSAASYETGVLLTSKEHQSTTYAILNFVILQSRSLHENKARFAYLAIALAVIPVGLLARSMRGGADGETFVGFILTYLGDTLWAVMFYYLFAACWIRLKVWAILLITLCFTVALEASQCYHGEPLSTLRGFALTRFLLGTNFLWSDIACLFIGSMVAALIHAIMRLRFSE